MHGLQRRRRRRHPTVTPRLRSTSRTYQLPQDDASIYLVEDCPSQHLCGRCGRPHRPSEELLAWYNDSPEPRELFLVLDAFQYPLTPAVTDVFYLDVSLTTFLSDVLADQCVDAMEQQPIVPARTRAASRGM